MATAEEVEESALPSTRNAALVVRMLTVVVFLEWWQLPPRGYTCRQLCVQTQDPAP